MTTTRTHEQLTDDLRQLKDYINDPANRASLERRVNNEGRTLHTTVSSLASRAEAVLDAYRIFPVDPWGDRLERANNLMARAWLRIQNPSITGQEIREYGPPVIEDHEVEEIPLGTEV